jgi:hypothetical protein
MIVCEKRCADDGLGSTPVLTDSMGAVQTQYTYEPFGRTTSSGIASSNGYQHTGRENAGAATMADRQWGCN